MIILCLHIGVIYMCLCVYVCVSPTHYAYLSTIYLPITYRSSLSVIYLSSVTYILSLSFNLSQWCAEASSCWFTGVTDTFSGVLQAGWGYVCNMEETVVRLFTQLAKDTNGTFPSWRAGFKIIYQYTIVGLVWKGTSYFIVEANMN